MENQLKMNSLLWDAEYEESGRGNSKKNAELVLQNR